MKLISKSDDFRWIIVDEVSDDDAAVLRACGYDYTYDVDENGYNGGDDGDYPYQIWSNVIRDAIREELFRKD